MRLTSILALSYGVTKTPATYKDLPGSYDLDDVEKGYVLVNSLHEISHEVVASR